MFGKRSNQPRTAEDRARAAAERAARRAGRPLPPEAFEYTVRPPDVEPHEPFEETPPAPDPTAWSGAEPPVEAEPHAEAERADAAGRRDAGSPVEAEPHAEVERADAAGRRDAGSPVEAEPPAVMPAPVEPGPAAHDPEIVHQPTVEYTPFQTEEHQLPQPDARDAPAEPSEPEAAGPRASEPRTRGAAAPDAFAGQSDRGAAARDAEPEPAAPRGSEAFATAEHEFPSPTGEYAFAPADSEPMAGDPVPDPPREPVPLRGAPERPAANPRRRAAPRTPRRTPPNGNAKTRRHWGRRAFALLVVLVVLAVLYAYNKTFQPFHGDGSGRVAVVIPDNSDAGAIGKLLEAKGVVDSARYFELNATISGDRGNLRPGRYTLRKGMTNGAVIDALTKVPDAPKQVETVDLTLIEGPSRRENAPVVDKSGKVEGSYAKATASKQVLQRIRKLGAPKGTKTAEGFLFPATYTLPVGSTAADLVDQQLTAFEDNFDKISMSRAKARNLTRYDVLIIASMIEREVSVPRERRLVSAVIYNRLKEGMTLSIDATIRYATDNWQRPIRQSELDKDGPYNTRLNRGLPPTPIGNPGLASLKAAANPADKPYLFYVRKPGKSGEHAFSSTDAQFARDNERYQASRSDG